MNEDISNSMEVRSKLQNLDFQTFIGIQKEIRKETQTE